jgi:hypothetical protein
MRSSDEHISFIYEAICLTVVTNSACTTTKHGELDLPWPLLFGNLVVSRAPSEDGPKGPKHVRDLKTLNNK